MRRTATATLVIAALLATSIVPAGQRAQLRLVERHAETITFPMLVERCKARPAFRAAPWAEDLAQWRARRAAVQAEGRALVEAAARAAGSDLGTVGDSIREQAAAQRGDDATLDYTCGRLGQTLRGEPWVPLRGNTLDEDTVREVLDELLPVAAKLMPCDRLDRIDIRPAPPPVLRADASSAAAIADRVEMWNAFGCGRSMDIELSLRFPDGEPPTFALGFPRTALPAAR